MRNIVVVEDDLLLNEALNRILKKSGYDVARAYSVKQGVNLINDDVALMIVDIGLPDGDGLEICRKAHEFNQIPVIFLTARDEEEDMLQAFNNGADDYIVKPFPLPILLKHVEAVLRRTSRENEEIIYRGLTIDFLRMQVKYEGKQLKLTAKEWKLLCLLAKNKNKVVTRRMILEQVWDEDGAFVDNNTIDVTLNRLKKKIEPDPANPVFIKNVFGLGYSFGE